MQNAPTRSGPVISNTTPLISLAEIGLLAVLHTIYGPLWIPQAVINEYQTGIATHPLRPSLSHVLWITIHAAPADPAVPPTLDPGEAEAIALARASAASLLLLDEQRGRAAARRLGLPVSGSLGVLLEARSAVLSH